MKADWAPIVEQEAIRRQQDRRRSRYTEARRFLDNMVISTVTPASRIDATHDIGTRRYRLERGPV
jgi:hypothetical protein